MKRLFSFSRIKGKWALCLCMGILGGMFFACEGSKRVSGAEIFSDTLHWRMRNEKVHMYYKREGRLNIEIEAQEEEELENGDIIFKEGVHIKHYNKLGVLSGVLQADTGIYYSEKEMYEAIGDVILYNYEANDTLFTRQLIWLPEEDRIYTQEYVEVHTEDGYLQGYGLYSSDDLSDYRILKPSGTMVLENKSP